MFTFYKVEILQKNRHKCPCILKTYLNKKHLIKIDHEHNHFSCQNEVDASKIKMQTKTQAKISRSIPAQLFSEAVTGLSESILEELPKEKSIKKTIQNQRTQNFAKVPDNLKDLKIEGMYSLLKIKKK